MSSIRENLAEIRDRIARSAGRSGRPVDRIRLVAVSKRVPADRIAEAISCGQTVFGENYLQEAAEKIEKIGRQCSWHMIGRLQSNKAAQTAELFNMIETVDRLKVARIIDQRLRELGRVVPVLVQVNIGAEPQKGGVMPEDAAGLIREIGDLANLRVMGLMAMPPYFDDPERARPFFRRTRDLATSLQGRGLLPDDGSLEISMGMSGDFEAAIEEGATMVRVGTALFGARD